MALVRICKSLLRLGFFEVAAIAGVIVYIVLQNALPPLAGQLLAGLILLAALAMLFRRLVRVIKDPVGSVSWRSSRR